MSRILVTGAAGFIGFETVKKLLAAGHEVVGVDNFDETLNPSSLRRARISEIETDSFEFLELDLVSCQLSEIVDSSDSIFHFAATPGLMPSWTNFKAYSDNNVVGSFKLAEAIEASSTSKNVFVASTSSVYGEIAIGAEDAGINPASPYGITKFASEQIFRAMVDASHHNLIILRLFSVYGPNQREDMAWQRIIRSINSGDPFPLTANSNHVRTCTYVGDIADFCTSLASSTAMPGTYNICGDEEVNTLEGIKLIERMMGKRLNVFQCEARKGDQIRTQGYSKLAKELLGFNPTTSFQEGIRNQINALE